MSVWKRNAVVAAIVLFVCGAVYLNWSYQNDETTDAGKTLGEAALVSGQTDDPLLTGTEDGSTSSEDPEDSDSSETSDTTQGTSSYFDAARLNRQQARDSALAILRDGMGEDADEATLEANLEAIQTLANYTVSEAQIENLVIAKGYTDCVAFIGDSSISVVVAATGDGLTDADVAKITEIVTDETGYQASQVKIIEAEG